MGIHWNKDDNELKIDGKLLWFLIIVAIALFIIVEGTDWL